MKYKTIILLEAAQDYKEAKNWYKKTNVQGLTKRFANTVKTAIIKLQERPTLYAIRYKNVRVVHTDKFPYSIHFFVDGNLIVITAIVYAGRDPKITLDRV
jgi:ParE toxin of type II toxin-antitoxin system, parDE